MRLLESPKKWINRILLDLTDKKGKDKIMKFKYRLKPILLFISVTILLVANCTGSRPNDIGVRDNGKLLSCPDTPNCVNSFSNENDEVHYIKPLKYSGDLNSAKSKLKKVILDQERVKIVTESDKYIYAEFTTLMMRFVDDVEFLFNDETKTLHFRSASRIGRKDFGVNRNRIEKIKTELDWN